MFNKIGRPSVVISLGSFRALGVGAGGHGRGAGYDTVHSTLISYEVNNKFLLPFAIMLDSLKGKKSYDSIGMVTCATIRIHTWFCIHTYVYDS